MVFQENSISRGLLSSQLKTNEQSTQAQVSDLQIKTDSVKQTYEQLRNRLGKESEALVIFSTFQKYLEKVEVRTVMELEDKLREAIKQLKDIAKQKISRNLRLENAIEIFQHQVEQTADRFKDNSTLIDFKNSLLKMCSELQQQAVDSMQKVSDKANLFIKQDYKILVHGNSMTIFMTIQKAISRGIYFNVYLTYSSKDMARALVDFNSDKKITCIAIPSEQIAKDMIDMDMVMLGAESVTILGGTINSLGSYSICLIAQSLHKRVYILADRFKYCILSPLTQNDIPLEQNKIDLDLPEGIQYRHHAWDYTPCQLIDFYVTDTGVVMPKNIGNQVRKIYNIGGAK